MLDNVPEIRRIRPGHKSVDPTELDQLDRQHFREALRHCINCIIYILVCLCVYIFKTSSLDNHDYIPRQIFPGQ